MHAKVLAWSLIPALLLCGWLAFVAPAAAEGARRPDSPTLPAHPRILEAAQAPRTAKILRQVALTYAPQMSEKDREIDFLQKITLAKRLLGVGRLVSLRHATLALLLPGQEVSWEDVRRRRWPGGDPVGVTLEVPVWVPARAQRLKTYSGFEKKWQTVALTTPRPSGCVWFVRTLKEVNDKTHYRPEMIQMEVNSKFAPLAALLLEYIFREGWYDPARRLPLLVVRAGEDTYAVSAASGPVSAECLTFPDSDGASMAATVAQCSYNNLADIFHGRHAPASNHRLGLAMDLNDFNYAGVVDGPPNPISRSLRQYNRDAMHKIDARHLPMWVYRAASWLGCRIPQSWAYYGYNVDWPHVDVGTK
ncbi:MAG: hypothetical protein KKD99_05670 [Proteobacteria bacterium]|nr:hypothetical protein [Pseudomonadota bacterium]